MRIPGGYKLLIILGVISVVVAWIASGVLFRTEGPEEPRVESDERKTLVAVRQSQAQSVERVLVLQGDLQPDQVVRVRAETNGTIEHWHVRAGAIVEADELIAQIELGERSSQLSQAQARLNVVEQQAYATRRLVKEGFEPEIRLDAVRADLEAAQADLAAVEEEISRTRIRSPIRGRLDERIAKTGDFVSLGAELASIVKNDPLLAIVRMPQHATGRIQEGQQARINVRMYNQAQGEVTFVSTLVDAATRTFRIEIEVPNPDLRLPAGTSVEVEIPTEKVFAHKVSPALIGLDDEGRVGIKTVDDDSRVEFHVIEAVRFERDGVWVAGLPERTRIITVGQGFVRAGEVVEIQPEEALNLQEPDSGQRVLQ